MKDTKKVHMIDPPGGWKYGFPKVVPKTFENWEEQKAWLISEGYPEKEIYGTEIDGTVRIERHRGTIDSLSLDSFVFDRMMGSTPFFRPKEIV